MRPLKAERSREGGSKTLLDLEKWKFSVFSYSNMSPNFSKEKR